MYLAGYRLDAKEIRSAAIFLPHASLTTTRPSIAAALVRHPDVDVALRISRGPAGSSQLILLTAVEPATAALQTCCRVLLEALGPEGAVMPTSAAEFDARVGFDAAWQARVNHAGYRHRGEVLACDFKLHAGLAGDAGAGAGAMLYQVNLRRHEPTPESERRARKALAWLDLEQPFTDPVRQMQRLLIERLRRPGWLGDEFLAIDRADALSRRIESLEEHFRQTTGRVGFQSLPVECGDFDEALNTGLTRTRLLGETSPPVVEGAEWFADDELDWLHSGAVLALARTVAATPGADEGRRVFVSYASGDYGHAAAVCKFLEDGGLPCWIAPRDINRDILPYTEAIERGIGQARAVVMLLSATANLSVHIPRELDLALERRLPIVPVRLEDVQPSGQLNYLLRTCQWLSAFDRSLPQACTELLRRLESLPDARR